MTKKFYTFALAALLAAGASARTLSPAEALARVSSDNGARRVAAKLKVSPQPVYTEATESGAPAVYVFADRSNGFMLLSAADVARPVLGYAEHGSGDTTEMAPAMKWWIEEYARQIAWAKERGIEPQAVSPKEGRRDIPAMIKTAWDQGEPYNELCPVVNGTRAYTGCVATAMSQILYYFKYPECGKGSISYNDEDGCGKRLTWNFADHPFDWDNMLLTYQAGKYNDDQAYAVAELMKSAGASVKMSYGTDASGALSMMPGQAFVRYFDYDPNLQYVLRSYVSASRWDEMVYDNLANVGPVLYGGASMLGGGHSFIVDGYQAETGLYHFNWGWSEMSDGYYSLDALNPSSLGTGGGEGGGYNFTQDGFFGIQPPTGKPAETQPIRLTQQGTLNGSVENNALTIELADDGEPMFINYTSYDLDVMFGLSFGKKDASPTDTTITAVSSPIALEAGYGASPKVCKSVNLTNLADGTYNVTMMTLITNREDQQWQPTQVNYGYSNSFELIKAGTRYRINYTPASFYTIDELSLEYDLYFGCLVKVNYKLTNNSDIEISRGIAPMFYDGSTPAFIGNSKLISLKPGETTEGSIVTMLQAMGQDYTNISANTTLYMTVMDETSMRVMADQVFGKVVMQPNPGFPSLTVEPAFEILNAEYNLQQKCYMVDDPANMEIAATVWLDGGYMAYPMYAAVLGNLNQSTGQAEILDLVGENVFIEDPNEPYDFYQVYNFKKAVVGETYYLALTIEYGSSYLPVNNKTPELMFKVVSYSGIENVEAENAPVEYFNLQGVKVDYDTAPAGIYIRRQGDKSEKILKK